MDAGRRRDGGQRGCQGALSPVGSYAAPHPAGGRLVSSGIRAALTDEFRAGFAGSNGGGDFGVDLRFRPCRRGGGLLMWRWPPFSSLVMRAWRPWYRFGAVAAGWSARGSCGRVSFQVA